MRLLLGNALTGIRLPRPNTPITLVKSGTTLYVRQPDWQRPDYDVVRRISDFGATPTTFGETGLTDFTGQVWIPSSTPRPDTASAYASGLPAWSSVDNGPPVKYNRTYLGAAHGLPSSHLLTINGHGLTNADVGDVGTVSGASWVLSAIIDANTVLVVKRNALTEDLWIISGTLTATGTITFTGAGAKSWTASTLVQVIPMVRNVVQTIMVDGGVVSANGVYSGAEVVISESYDIPNAGNWQEQIIAQKGTSTPKWINDADVTTQSTVENSWRFDRYGAMIGDCTFSTSQQLLMDALDGGEDYVGGWQHTALAREGHTLWQYIPDLSGAVGGYDLTAGANITSNASTVQVNKSDAVDQDDPPSHFAQFLKSGSDPVFGTAMGYIRTRGAGQPSYRSTRTLLWQMSPLEKQYPAAIDATGFGGGVVPSGYEQLIAFWDASYDMTTHPTHTVDAAYEDGGKVYRVIDIHATETDYSIDVPVGLVGQPATVIASRNFTLSSSEVEEDGTLTISTSSGHGWAVIEIG